MPFTDDGHGHHFRPAVRRIDAGVSFGGPVYIPKVYNGRNRTFFFFNYEKYRDRQNAYMGLGTVPTAKMRAGDFSETLTNRNLGTDFAGRPILENVIYDPNTRTTDSSGRFIVNPFAGNIIPNNRLDPVALKILSYIPLPTNPNSIVNNYELRNPFHKIQDLPSFKIDHNLNSSSRISVYFADEITDKDVGQDGFPDPISIRRALHINGINARINYDSSITPTLLLHLGAGVQRYVNPDSSPPSRSPISIQPACSALRARRAPASRALGRRHHHLRRPRAIVLATSTSFGPVNRGKYFGTKPTALAQSTWVHNNHTYKLGGEWKIDTFTNFRLRRPGPDFGFSTAQTAQPLYGGLFPAERPSATRSPVSCWPLQQRQHRQRPGAAVSQVVVGALPPGHLEGHTQTDSRLRITLGPAEAHARIERPHQRVQRDVINPNANSLPGGVIYEGNGPGRCNCNLVDTYPYASGPRLGVAYQLNAKTVIRAGWGIVYGSSNTFSYIGGGNSQGMGFNTINFTSPGNGVEAGKLVQRPLLGSERPVSAPAIIPACWSSGRRRAERAGRDRSQRRPPAAHQPVEHLGAARDHQGPGRRRSPTSATAAPGYRTTWSTTTPSTRQRCTALGLDITNAADRTLLTSSITSSIAVARGFKKPYANFPDTGTVMQSLRPFPQYAGIGSIWAPLGKPGTTRSRRR